MKENVLTADFTHKTKVTVRFHEVDMLGVCNNAVYINFFEHARLEYLRDLGLIPKDGLFSDNLFYMVRNEINYLAHARYNDELYVYSRITYIKNSSYGFDHMVTLASTGKVLAEGKGVVVQVSPKEEKPVPLSDFFRQTVTAYEKHVELKGKET